VVGYVTNDLFVGGVPIAVRINSMEELPPVFFHLVDNERLYTVKI